MAGASQGAEKRLVGVAMTDDLRRSFSKEQSASN